MLSADAASVTHPVVPSVDRREDALCQLLAALARAGYQFRTVTPLTHQRVLAKRPAPAADLRDIFGWNLPFLPHTVPAPILAPAVEAGILHADGGMARSRLRVASLGPDLFLHSGFPTIEADAVFFGPDTYRFVRFVDAALDGSPRRTGRPLRILDLGCGSGAGGIAAARRMMAQGVQVELTLNDINPGAIALSAANARAAGLPASLVRGDALSAIEGEFDLVISNPPYIQDDARRAYRHGGERLGRDLSVRIAASALGRLAPGGRLLLYTGVAMVDQHDPFLAEVRPLLEASGCSWSYEEIDPDVFGEELDRPAYQRAHRIAAVGLCATNGNGACDAC
jgi:SAM-dependent methyltransferase